MTAFLVGEFGLGLMERRPVAVIFGERVGRSLALLSLTMLVTIAVGSMWCAYLFTVLALFALPDAIKQGTYFVVVWLSSSFLQLVLLPIIIVGQNIQAKASDARAQATYDDASAVLDKATQIQSHLLTIQAHLEAQDDQILAILNRVSGGPDPAGH